MSWIKETAKILFFSLAPDLIKFIKRKIQDYANSEKKDSTRNETNGKTNESDAK